MMKIIGFAEDFVEVHVNLRLGAVVEYIFRREAGTIFLDFNGLKHF